MAFNYTNLGNQTLENILPSFSPMTNGATMASYPTFINQLAAAITTAAVGATSTTLTAANVKRDVTPEPPPAPKLSSLDSRKMKPNQGTAPMDLENESDIDVITTTITTSPITSSSTTGTVACVGSTKSIDKIQLNMRDPNLFLNGLMSTSVNPTAAGGYMFFPTTTTTAATPNSAATPASILMDPTAMMAAAMQQMQQNFPGYTLPESTIDGAQIAASTEPYATTPNIKEVIKTKGCTLFPPNPNAPPPTIRERPPGCRTVFVGGLPENISEEIIREIFESCGEITTLRMSKKNFCHIRYRHEASIDRAIYISGYRVRISNGNEPANFGRLHVDYAQARDDQYDYECKQRQLQREQRHRERLSLDRLRSQSPPSVPHYSDHEASLVSESLRNNETFVKAVQTFTAWLERGHCTKRNAYIFYSMIQITHGHVRCLYSDKQQLEADLRKTRENYRKQMLTMSTQFTQIEKVFSAASHKKVWDHFTKAQRKNIDQWKKLATELRCVQIEDDEMEMSDDDRDYQSTTSKRVRYDSENLKEENDSLRCQIEAIRNEMCLERTDIKYNSDFREKQIKVLQETIRNMQTQLLQTKMREQKDAKIIEQLERKLKEAGVMQLLLKTKIKNNAAKLRDKEATSSINSETSEILIEEYSGDCDVGNKNKTEILDNPNKGKDIEKKSNESNENTHIIDIDMYKSDDDVKIIEEQSEVVEIHEVEDDRNEAKRDYDFTDHDKTYNQTKELSKRIVDQTNHLILSTDIEKNVEPKSIEKSYDDNLNDHEVFKSIALIEAKIIALTSTFLIVHPLGETSESICSYLDKLIIPHRLGNKSLNEILKKYTNIFKADTDAYDRNSGVLWRFCGHDLTKC